ncbi:MAG: hypothetical protein H0W36_14155 [Gemmatimonadetes bacterium]|nr:hypothetical protein [Gemmatimonadota bacterium]
MPVRRPTDPTVPVLPKPPPISTESYVLGSYGVPSIDAHDAAFLAGSHAVAAKRGVRVDPRVLKGMMGGESGEDGTYPVERCRPFDGHPGPRSCGPMQIKWGFHVQRCPECDEGTVAGHVEMAAHIIGMTMLAHVCDEYEAYIRGYLTSDDINGTSQQAAVKAIKKRVARMEADADAGPSKPKPEPPEPADPWRPYPYPKMVNLIVQKPADDNAGFNRCAFRRPNIRGFCTHITDGPPSQTIEFFASFFGTGGERAWDALTDLVVGWDGRIGLLNDWRDPERGGTRAGWANGGVDGLEGEGVAFFRRFPAINEVLVSCEHAQKAGGEWSDAMLASTIELRTAIAQELKCPADSYPYHPSHGGVSIEQQHRNFATKSCPAEPYIGRYDKAVRIAVKEKLAAWQGGSVVAPPPEPVKTFTDWGMTLAHVANYFGVLHRVNAGGTVDKLPFDPAGPVSLVWLKRCEEEGKFPEAEEMRLFDSGIRPGQEWWITFEGGWTLVKSAGDTRDAWRWLDRLEDA